MYIDHDDISILPIVRLPDDLFLETAMKIKTLIGRFPDLMLSEWGGSGTRKSQEPDLEFISRSEMIRAKTVRGSGIS